MESQEKNRLYFDDENDLPKDEQVRWTYSDNGDFASVNLDEESPGRAERRRWIQIIAGSAIVLLLAGFGLFTYFYTTGYFTEKKSEQAGETLIKGLDDETSTRERIYRPAGKYSDPLVSAIQLYKTNERDAARRAFEKLVESPADDREKSASLVYLGIMAMETERWGLARHQLERALKYNDKSVAAHVNMAIVLQKLGENDLAREFALEARKLAPDDSAVVMILGNLLAGSGDLEDAVASYKTAADTSPDDPGIHYNLALALLRQEKVEEAVASFARVIDLAEGGDLAARSHSHLGQIYFARGNLEMAADHLRKAAKLVPDNGRYHYNLGVVYLRMHRTQDAIARFEKALEAGDNDVQVFRGLAGAFKDLNQPALAIRSLKKALYLNPHDIETLFSLGDIYSKEKDLLAAADTFTKIVNITPGNADTEDALLKLGLTYMDLERHNHAVEIFERVLRLNPHRAEALFGLGAAYSAAGRTDEAVAAWKKALGNDRPGDNNAFRLSRDDEKMIRMALAETYRKNGSFEAALNEYRLIQNLNKKPPEIVDDPELNAAFAVTYTAVKDTSGAIQSWKLVADSSNVDTELRKRAFVGLAGLYVTGDGLQDLDMARSWANRAARLDPTDQSIRTLQARILVESSSPVDREKAIEILRAVTASDTEPNLASRAYTIMGQAYMENGEYSRAIQSFDYAIQLNPGNTAAYEKQRAASNAYERNPGN